MDLPSDGDLAGSEPDSGEPGAGEQMGSVRPILIASALILVALWFVGSLISPSDVVHAIGHLLPGGAEACGGG